MKLKVLIVGLGSAGKRHATYQKIHPPHTYYFTKKFFESCFKKIDICKFYRGEEEVANDNESNILRIFTKDRILLTNKN